MTVRVVHRPARITTPLEAAEPFDLAAPPQTGDQQTGFPMQSLLPIVGSIGSITMMTVMRGNPMMVVVGALILVVALVGGLGMAFSSRANQARQRRTQRERYLDYLERTRLELRESGTTARDTALAHHPAPSALIAIGVDPGRRWERRPGDADFMHVRWGTADAPAINVQMPKDENPIQPFDPIMHSAAEQVIRMAGTVQGLPQTLDLSRGGSMSIVGPRAQRQHVARALIAQLANFHAPEEVHIAGVIPQDQLAAWNGFDLLPHVNRVSEDERPLRRRIAPTAAALQSVIGDEVAERASLTAAAKRAGRKATPTRLVIVVDDEQPVTIPLPDSAASLADLGITVVQLVAERVNEPGEVAARITISDDLAKLEYEATRDDDATEISNITIDTVSPELLDFIARPLSPLRLVRPRLATVSGAGVVTADMDDVLGLDDVDNLDPRVSWQPRSDPDFLRVPVGLDDDGGAVLLDIKEAAQLGMGPHGICIGATGSGKSELLRTLILELAMTHSPEDLSMILVDYKGGAAFAPFIPLPHIAGVIDNLADDAQLTERARASINGEVVRRQRMLKDAGSVASIGHYRELRKERHDLPAMPHLFLVIDEFGELLTAEPDFVDLLLTIGRIGRSIGVHLLLSSQRIEAGKLRGLDTYLSYRIGLRTFSEAESTVVLSTPDAFHLPAVPGYGYLKVDTTVYTRFRSGYVSGPVPITREADDGSSFLPESRTVFAVPAYDLPRENASDDDLTDSPAQSTAMTTGRTVLDTAVGRLKHGAEATQPVWLPPLPPRLALGAVLPSFTPTAKGEVRELSAVIGLIDDPNNQSQAPWALDLTRSGGHVTITGAPQSGRSTFLRTLAASLSFSHTPREISIYGMDLTGGGLTRIEPFPHVGGVATRGNREKLERLVEELTGMLHTREEVFRDANLDSVADMRRQHAAGLLPALPSADVLLLIDGFGALRNDFEDLDPAITTLLERGSSFGIHVIAALGRWGELRLAQQALVGTRLELKLNDPGDSQTARKLSATLRSDEPGRVLTDEKLFAQIALPLLEEADETTDIGEELEQLARASAESWAGPEAAPIRLLPLDLNPAALPDALVETDRVPVGLRQDSMQPMLLDFAATDLHLLVYGDSQSGKSTLLRGVVQGLVDRYSSEEIVIALMDPRSTLVGDVPEEHLGGHATNGRMARQLAESVAVELEARQSDPSSGPRIVVIADDFDILSAGGVDPLGPLVPYLASARDLRLNVVMARPVAGAVRAMFDPALQTLRDTGGSTFLMSGDRGEGQLLPRIFAEPMPPGRGRLIRRGIRPALVQVANFTPAGARPATPAWDAAPAPAPTRRAARQAEGENNASQ